MSTHIRAQVRHALVAALTGLPTTGARVYSVARAGSVVPAANLPCLRVYSFREVIEPNGRRANPYKRRVEGVVEIVVKGGDDYLDRLDAIAVEVERAIDTSAGLGGVVQLIEPRHYEPREDASGDQVVAVGTYTFEAHTLTQPGVPDPIF